MTFVQTFVGNFCRHKPSACRVEEAIDLQVLAAVGAAIDPELNAAVGRRVEPAVRKGKVASRRGDGGADE